MIDTIVSSYTHAVHLEWVHSPGFSNAVKASTAGTTMTLSPSLERALTTTAPPRCQGRLETAYRTQEREGHGREWWISVDFLSETVFIYLETERTGSLAIRRSESATCKFSIELKPTCDWFHTATQHILERRYSFSLLE